MSRPKKYTNESDRLKAIKDSKTKYMINKEWICDKCENKNYTLAGKWTHLKTKKHKINVSKLNAL